MAISVSNSDTSILGNDSQKLSIFDYFFVFALIIYSGRANTFVESGSFTENPVGDLLPVILSGILILRRSVLFDLRFYILLFGFTIYFIAISLKYLSIHPSFLLNYFFKFFIVYAAIKALKYNLFRIYEYVVYYLAIIALVMWSIQIILGGDTLFLYFGKVPGMDAFSYVTGIGYNAIIYSVQHTSYSILGNIPIPRNWGYAQEPGSFAVYLCLAIFINLFIKDSNSNNKNRFWILVVALLSTQSTTGYIIFMVIIGYYIMNKSLNKMLLLLPFVSITMIYIFSLPFMSAKIFDLINETNELDQLLANTIGREQTATPQRFSSFIITFVDFRNNPILGLGPDGARSWVNQIGARISPISGIGNLMAQFGLVGFLFFMIATLRSSFFFSKYFNYKGRFLLFIIIILISVSYSIILLPLLMSFWMFRLFAPTGAKQKESDGLAL